MQQNFGLAYLMMVTMRRGEGPTLTRRRLPGAR